MQKAIKLSKEHMTKGHGGPFGAVIVRRGQIVAEGWNQVTSTNDPTAHAEIVAIRIAAKKLNNFDLSDCEIYTSCEPCPMCLSAIYWARIRKIYYGNSRKDAAKINFDDEFLYHEIKRPLKQRKVPLKQLMRKEALKIFQDWQNKKDKNLY
ncbi:MAG: nucleoside deaminase [Deltaproteobacteria bacterium]|nr:nucleoside deaminase [Deltaproteobacteria bacterium]MBI4925685.1 nucleoside deaminase [Bdellovibrio sp.]